MALLNINKIDTFQTRFFQSFVNLTKYDSTLYPAVTTFVTQRQENCPSCPPLSTYNIYDQWALRVLTGTVPLNTVKA
jgi:hypothetical protein